MRSDQEENENRANDPAEREAEINGPKCDHDWAQISDWTGDPDVIGGTYDCSFWRCKICGEEDYERAIELPTKEEDDVI